MNQPPRAPNWGQALVDALRRATPADWAAARDERDNDQEHPPQKPAARPAEPEQG